jgi:hypothetical protein
VSPGREGALHTEEPADLVPVLRERLRAYSRTVRGPADPPVTRYQLVASCRADLGDYWRPFARRVAPARQTGMTCGDAASTPSASARSPRGLFLPAHAGRWW